MGDESDEQVWRQVLAGHSRLFGVIWDRHDERHVALRAAMTTARPADAALLGLTVLEGFTVREAAAVLGISESAAKMRLTRVRARLRDSVAARILLEGES